MKRKELLNRITEIKTRSAWKEALEMDVSAIWEETVQGVSVLNVEVK